MSCDLGFLDDTCGLLESRFFPSKIGGQPAWLDLKHVPSSEDLKCNKCGVPRQFLCQLYSPVEGNDAAFHRTVFVFLCVTKNCFHPNNGDNFIVYRCQLPLDNAYYPNTPPEDDIRWRPDITCNKFGTKLCHVCGLRGHIEDDQDRTFCSNYHRESRPNLLPECALRIESEDATDEEGSEMSSSESETEADESWKPASSHLSQGSHFKFFNFALTIM